MTDKQSMKIYTQLDEMLKITNAATIRNMLIALLLARSEKMGGKEGEETKKEAWKIGAAL